MCCDHIVFFQCTDQWIPWESTHISHQNVLSNCKTLCAWLWNCFDEIGSWGNSNGNSKVHMAGKDQSGWVLQLQLYIEQWSLLGCMYCMYLWGNVVFREMGRGLGRGKTVHISLLCGPWDDIGGLLLKESSLLLHGLLSI